MASSIQFGLILFALLHLGMTYTIWGPRAEHEAILDTILDVYKSVNKNPKTSDIDEESKLLGSKLLSVLNQTNGIQVGAELIFDYKPGRYVSEIINVIAHRNGDLKLKRAEEEIHKSRSLYFNNYQHFLKGEMLPDEVKKFYRNVLKLDNEQSFEYSQAMSSFFKLYATGSHGKFENYHHTFPTKMTFLNDLFIYNQRHEWNTFMMITTVYKLQSLESNNNDYVKEFNRLKKQLLDKLKMHEDIYLATLVLVRSEKM